MSHNHQSSLLAASQMTNNKMMPPPPPPPTFMQQQLQQQSTTTPIGPIGSAAAASIVVSANYNNQPLHSMLNMMSLQHQQQPQQPPMNQCSMNNNGGFPAGGNMNINNGSAQQHSTHKPLNSDVSQMQTTKATRRNNKNNKNHKNNGSSAATSNNGYTTTSDYASASSTPATVSASSLNPLSNGSLLFNGASSSADYGSMGSMLPPPPQPSHHYTNLASGGGGAIHFQSGMYHPAHHAAAQMLGGSANINNNNNNSNGGVYNHMSQQQQMHQQQWPNSATTANINNNNSGGSNGNSSSMIDLLNPMSHGFNNNNNNNANSMFSAPVPPSMDLLYGGGGGSMQQANGNMHLQGAGGGQMYNQQQMMMNNMMGGHHHQQQQAQQPAMPMNHHMTNTTSASAAGHPMLQSTSAAQHHQMNNFNQNHQAPPLPPPPFNYHPHAHHSQYGMNNASMMLNYQMPYMYAPSMMPNYQMPYMYAPSVGPNHQTPHINHQLMHNNTFNLIKPVQSEFVMPQPQSMPQHHHHQQQQLYNHQPAHFQQHNMHHNPQSSPAAAPPPIIINSNNNSTCSSSTTPNTDQQQHQQHHQTSSSSPSGLLTSKPLTPPTSTMTSNPVAGGNSSSSSASSVVNLSSSLASSKSIDSTGSTSNLLAAAFNLGRKHHSSNNLSQQQATTTTAHLVCKMKIPSASDQSATGNDISAGVGLTQASLTVSDIPSVMVSLFSQFSKKLLERVDESDNKMAQFSKQLLDRVDKSDKKIEQVSENPLKEVNTIRIQQSNQFRKMINNRSKLTFSFTTLKQAWTAMENADQKTINQTGPFVGCQEGDFHHATEITRRWFHYKQSNKKPRAEKILQAGFMKFLFALKNKCEPPTDVTEHVYGAYDTHAVSYLPIAISASAVQPDFAIHASSNLKDRWQCIFIIELQTGPLDGAHKAKVVIYNQLILQLNPARRYVISVLTNMVDVMFFKTERSNLKHYEYDHCYFYDTLYNQDGDKCGSGLTRLVYCLENPSDVGFSPRKNLSDGNIDFYIDSYLGYGSNATVFQTLPAGDKKQRFAIKVYSTSCISSIDKEAEMLTKFRGDKLFVQLHHHDRANNALILSPCGQPLESLTGDFPYSSEYLEHLINILSHLRDRKVVHRDISPKHFYYDDTQVFLIDFSSAVNENEVTNFVGTSHFAAKEIYDHYVDKTASSYTPLCRHDLESFAKCFVYHWGPFVKNRMDNLLEKLETLREENREFDEMSEMSTFWEDTENKLSSDVYNILISARAGDYDQVANGLRSFFAKR